MVVRIILATLAVAFVVYISWQTYEAGELNRMFVQRIQRDKNPVMFTFVLLVRAVGALALVALLVWPRGQ